MAYSNTTFDRVVIPVVEESLSVEKRVVETGRVRIEKTVETEQVIVDEPIVREEVRIERRAVNAPVQADAVPVTRTEGDTTIIPILEEVLVVEKRLVLREELRVTRVRHVEHSPQEVTLRREQAHVERSHGDGTEEDASQRSVPHV